MGGQAWPRPSLLGAVEVAVAYMHCAVTCPAPAYHWHNRRQLLTGLDAGYTPVFVHMVGEHLRQNVARAELQIG